MEGEVTRWMVSDRGEGTPERGLAEVQAGVGVLWEETLWWEKAGEPFTPVGDPIGTVSMKLNESKKKPGWAICDVYLRLDEGSELVAAGSLPRKGTDVGDGEVLVTAGTGVFENAKHVHVRSKNPKRWGAD
jgi:hypothetical protein